MISRKSRHINRYKGQITPVTTGIYRIVYSGIFALPYNHSIRAMDERFIIAQIHGNQINTRKKISVRSDMRCTSYTIDSA